ncbi:hypothetical protein GCM10009675_47590 [Prauserella alba]|uniref:Uncharacterized protein n=1 Tax=Prauserella alba TaxID=176898 RepID=A0ABP4GEQ9_9PSEU
MQADDRGGSRADGVLERPEERAGVRGLCADRFVVAQPAQEFVAVVAVLVVDAVADDDLDRHDGDVPLLGGPFRQAGRGIGDHCDRHATDVTPRSSKVCTH